MAAPNTQALYIDANNAGAGQAPVSVAAASGEAFCIQTRSDVLALDSDIPWDPAFDQIKSEAEALGLPCWTVASGGEGRRHLWVVGVTSDQRDALTGRARALGLDSRVGPNRIRPPYSPWRRDTSVRSEVEGDPLAFLEAVRSLGPAPTSLPAVRAVIRATTSTARREWRPLPQTTWDMVHGKGGRYAEDRHRRDAAIALSCVNNGWTEEDYVRLRLGPQTGSPKALEMTPEAADAYLRDKYRSAVQKAEDSLAFGCPDDVRAELDLIETQVQSHRFPGRSTVLLRNAMLAFVAKAREVNRLEVAYDCRSLGERIGRSVSSISERVLPQLRASGFLVLVEQDQRRINANVYRLQSQKCRKPEHSEPVLPRGARVECSGFRQEVPRDHPAFHWGALNPSGYETLLSYDVDTPRSKAEARQLTNLHRSTHSKSTEQLLLVGGLVIAANGGILRAQHFDLDQVAAFYGTDQRAEARRQRHDLDRVSRLQHALDEVWRRAGGDGRCPLSASTGRHATHAASGEELTAAEAYERLHRLARLQRTPPVVDPETGEVVEGAHVSLKEGSVVITRRREDKRTTSAHWKPMAAVGEETVEEPEAPEEEALKSLGKIGDELISLKEVTR